MILFLALTSMVAVADVGSGELLHVEEPAALDSYEALPGSVEKLVTAVAAVESGLADAALPRALALSDGDYFTRLRARVPPERLAEVGRRLGFGGELDRKLKRVRPRLLLELARTLAREAPDAVREGMRQASEYGTAHVPDARVAFAGKTGTASRAGGGLCGWFIGFAPPERPRVAVVAAVVKGRGADAAVLASRALDAVLAPPALPSEVSVEGRKVPLEEYVAGVVTAEEGDGTPESQKALAVLARTFAVRERGRHGRYDFCPLTHCQAFHPPSAQGRAAAAATRGQLLRSAGGELAPAHYFSTCGGRTADSEDIWPALRPALAGVSDQERCAGSPHLLWRFTTDAARLQPLFGFVPEEIVVERGAGGWVRAATVRGAGGERRYGGEELHLLLARHFGWNQVKSANFSVERAGEQFILRGRGMGHGVGLCQWGARAQARAGSDYRQILRVYFPGSTVTP
jgi:SpoIID/LytB domain protein